MALRRGVRRGERRFRVAACVLGVVAALHGLVYVPFAGHRLGDTEGYVAAAHAILHGGYTTRLGPVDVTDLRIPPDARGSPERETYRPPGYPLLLAVTGGGGPGAATDAIIAVQALLMGATTLILTLLARRLWSERAALMAGTLSALDPFTKHYVTRILSEVLAGFLVALLAYLFVLAWQRRSTAWWAVTGLAASALTLTRPQFALVIPLVGVAALAQHAPSAARLRRLAALGAGVAVLLVPWVAWTTEATGRPVLKSFGEGWNLLIAAHGEGLRRTAVEVESSPAYRRDFLSVHRFAPSDKELRTDATAHPRYLVRADAGLRAGAWHLLRRRLQKDPLPVFGETVYRGYFLWQAREDWVQPAWLLPLLRAVDWVSLALLLGGILVALRGGGPAGWLGLMLLVFTVVSATHHVEARYSMPVRGLGLAFAASGLMALGSVSTRLRFSRRSTSPGA
jgi:4-amino-4-deoxy-L-arabinose transferase-like glycosyltransferase